VVVATAAATGGGCRQLFGIDDTVLADDNHAGDAAGTADAPPLPVDACGLTPIGSIDPCGLGAPDGPLTLDGTLNTDTDPRCRSYGLATGGAACAIYADGITVADALTLTVSGSIPLILVSTQDIAIDGELDVSSRTTGQLGAAANDSSCAAALLPEADLGGGGGGAGGSFGSAGGDGGVGDTNTGAGNDGDGAAGIAGSPVVGIPASIRGGCRGSNGGDEAPGGGLGGAGGSSGGAVWLAARGMVVVGGNGVIRATGAGGGGGQVQAGGGGAGSGGMVVIEAIATEVLGVIAANGGGGGGGGVRISGAPYSGNPGQDGRPDDQVATGGTGGPVAAGKGGNGAAGSQVAKVGQSSAVGAGGGGGGGGIIHIVGPYIGGGTISPPPI
jgi:hypothetical protein